MKLIKLFTREDCPNCPQAKRVVEEYIRNRKDSRARGVEYWDIGTVDGLAESALYDVFGCPTVLIFKDDKEVKRIIGSVREEDLI